MREAAHKARAGGPVIGSHVFTHQRAYRCDVFVGGTNQSQKINGEGHTSCCMRRAVDAAVFDITRGRFAQIVADRCQRQDQYLLAVQIATAGDRAFADIQRVDPHIPLGMMDEVLRTAHQCGQHGVVPEPAGCIQHHQPGPRMRCQCKQPPFVPYPLDGDLSDTVDHSQCMCQGLWCDTEVELASKAHQPQHPQRIIGKRCADVAQHPMPQICKPTVRIDQRPIGQNRQRIDGQITPCSSRVHICVGRHRDVDRVRGSPDANHLPVAPDRPAWHHVGIAPLEVCQRWCNHLDVDIDDRPAEHQITHRPTHDAPLPS